MANISLTPDTNSFFGSFLKSPTQMESLGINNSVTNISRLGTFKGSDQRVDLRVECKPFGLGILVLDIILSFYRAVILIENLSRNIFVK